MPHALPIGVLGLQGDFEAHARALDDVGEPARIVRRAEELAGICGLIIPGGESTTLVKLMNDCGLVEPLRRLHAAGTPVYGTCAGAILLATRVTGPEQFCLAFIDIDVERNAYGRQLESFETTMGSMEPDSGLTLDEGEGRAPDRLELILIRAPRIRRCGPEVRVLIRHSGEPVLVRQGTVLAGTFHPELGRERSIHRYFAAMARRAAKAA
ncbi:MAG TPA: pyridoxal 5'-phosphate synthase glutaminase subunit PdxT [Patescibacteria group bacterium]|jgi:5'-phosphate synthase pdxT subunit|nr:pyridoxal 5'-phosphate synthase glutaminase subunit PdxT [Patescibacteria group bacterium]